MRRGMRARLLAATGVCVLVLGAGCAGSKLASDTSFKDQVLELPKGLSKELSKELKDKFLLSDVSAPAAKPKIKKTKSKQKAFAYPNRRPSADPIWPGEKQVFDITYLGMPAGTFTLEALPYKRVGDRKAYHMRATAVSSDLVNLVYKFNDSMESFIDFEGFFSHRFHLVQDETKQYRDSLELYDSEKRKTFYWNRWTRRDQNNSFEEAKDFHPMEPFSHDILSAIMFMRVAQVEEGKDTVFPISNEGRKYEAYVRLLRREVIRLPDGDRAQALVFQPKTKKDGQWQQTGEIFLWMTDDARRMPVRLEAKVRIGAVILTLRELVMSSPPEPDAPATPVPSPSGTSAARGAHSMPSEIPKS